MMGQWNFSPGSYLAPGVDWLNTHLHFLFAMISLGIESILNGFEDLLLALPAVGLIALVALLAKLTTSFRIAVLSTLLLGFCLLVGLWTATMQTIALVLLAVVTSILVAFPLGIVAAHNRRVESALRPILDIMQTVPPWVYLIPAVMIFSLGPVPAVMATIIYGIPPLLRLTTLAFQQVPKDQLELGAAIGASPRDVMWKIELPAALPTVLIGLNQCILLSLAMAVLAGLVGAGGLGAEVTRGLTRMEMGLGLRAGLAIVAVAILLDRLSKGALRRARGQIIS